ncbi:MAG: tricorn protease [Ignavibacteriota bacterium]|nr:MAG: tricorn protease [Ignavibacteriota bacterium]
MKKYFSVFIFFVFSISLFCQSEELTRLLRFPDISKDKIAFVYAGDIWIVDANGGTARQLTSHKGIELFPKFSPDGKWIAFSAEYSGNRQVYIISVDGGTPTQLTYYNDVGIMPPRGGFDYQVLGWTPDGKNVLFRGNRLPWGERMGKYFLVPIAGGFETPLQIPEGGGGMLSPDGTKMVYTPIEREWRTWKRYRGGRAQDVWIYDLKNNTTEKITDWLGTDNQPMWIGEKIYFTSDRTGTLNLYSYDLTSKQTSSLTDFDNYDVLWPSAGDDKIVYENGGYIYKYDITTNKYELVPIKVFGDFPGTFPYIKNLKDHVNWFEISPTGKRALLEARGDVFTVPAENGEIINITQTPGIREIDPVWSPDGKWIAYLSDRTGEYEIYTKSSDGSGEEKQITNDGTIWRFSPVWSPDSKQIAFADKNQKLWYVNVDDGNQIEVDHSNYNDITDYKWSPDSKWLTYTKSDESRMGSIWVYSLDKKEITKLTSSLTDEFNPVFSKDGKYIYFFSNRDFNLEFSSWEFNYVYTNPTRVYCAALNNDVPALFQPKNDEEITNNESKENNDTGEVVVKIDPENFENRINVLPGKSGNYSSLYPTEKGVAYIFQNDSGSRLKLFNQKDEKETAILEDIGNYLVSSDGKKIIYSKGSDYGIIDIKENQKNTDGRIDLSKLDVKIFPKAEWEEIFVDGWRLLRDWFYDANMHGVDWNEMKEKYGQLVPYVSHRMDLDYIFGELGGELNSGHVYVDWGDFERVKRIDSGLLGCELEADPSGFFKITKIYKGENWHSDFRSPLTEHGVDVKEGDFIIAINGQEVKTNENPYKFLENKAGIVITLLVNSKPSKDGAREEKVKPISNEGNLRYLDWVNSRMKIVDELSGGKIGYIHIPNTAVEGNRELFKYFYPQTNKEALIIDDRYNGGGFVPDRMIELVSRKTLNYWVRRGTEPTPVPGFVMDGPKVCLINGYSSSGGDAFPYYFREKNLGKIIGTRTWGGLIGLSGNPNLMDGGSISIPTFRFLDTNGNWAVENEGVYPDIEVLDRADLVVKGEDPSLEKAVEVLLEELKNNPPKKLVVPPPPDESKK